MQQYFGPIEINTDTGFLAGHSLLITERDNLLKKSGHYVLKKAASVGYRSKTSRLFPSASTEESIESNDLLKAAKQTKQRWSLQLFGSKVKFHRLIDSGLILRLFSVLVESPTEPPLRTLKYVYEKWRS